MSTIDKYPYQNDDLKGKIHQEEDIKILELSLDSHKSLYFLEVISDVNIPEYIEVSQDIFDLYMDDIKFLRRMYKQHKNKIADQADVDLLSYRQSLEDRVFNRQLLVMVKEILETCTDLQKKRFLLYFIEGYTYKEIADECHCNISSVAESIHKVLDKIRNLNINNL